jgi:uncharacterized protein YkwD
VATVTGVLPVAIPSPASARAAGARSDRAHEARGCANANRSAASASIPALRAAVVCLINQQRADHHLPALSADVRLDTSAQRWSNAMVVRHVFTHGTNFAARISAAGYRWSAAGENIATGYRTPRRVVRAWMASARHCENILSPTYGSVGTGINRHGVRGYASGPATWTQDFALARGHPAPSHNTGPAKGCPY